jgi:hypothetical protein
MMVEYFERGYVSEYITGDTLHGRTGAIISMYLKSGYELVSVCGDSRFREIYLKKACEPEDQETEKFDGNTIIHTPESPSSGPSKEVMKTLTDLLDEKDQEP